MTNERKRKRESDVAEQISNAKTKWGKFEGLFTPSTTSRFVGQHKDTRKLSRKGQIESEHMIPQKALKESKTKYNYNTEPTISIPYEMHRAGQSGAGGGVSSTGSSGVAQGWSKRIAELIERGNWQEAINLTAIDEVHAAEATRNLDEGMVLGIMRVVQEYQGMGRITEEEAGKIQTNIYNLYDFYKKHGSAK